MSYVPLNELSDRARLWVFPSSTAITQDQQEALETSIQQALQSWNAHGSPVRWGFEFIYHQFLLIAVDEDATALTGCSIDSAVHAIQGMEAQYGLVLTDSHRIFFRKDQSIVAASRAHFAEITEQGDVTLDTTVFDTVISNLGAFRSGQWELAARNTWHADVFPFKVTS
jgi:hypothetical protein